MSSNVVSFPPSVFTATQNGLVPLSGGGGTKYLRDDGTWVTPASSSFTMTEVEIDFGTKPQWGKTFTVTDAAVAATSKISAWASGNVATSRVGNDNEWDMMLYAALAGTGQFTLTAMAFPGPIVGKRKVYYAIA